MNRRGFLKGLGAGLFSLLLGRKGMSSDVAMEDQPQEYDDMSTTQEYDVSTKTGCTVFPSHDIDVEAYCRAIHDLES